ncbi:MAG: PTS sugar transporter subunit IIA [Kiritimatiellae bacterium]|nr:PTS sugar transporter subunit IIA [Kiritimatiellia bacterium]
MQMTVKDAAQALKVADKTIYRWIQGAGLPAYRVAGQYRINRAMLFEWASGKRLNFSSNLAAEDPPADAALPTAADALRAGGIHRGLRGATVEDVLREVSRIAAIPENIDRDLLFHTMLARENLQSTGVGDGVAIPHVRNPAVLEVSSPLAMLCSLAEPIEFHALDGKRVDRLFVLLTPTVRIHLHLLSRISFALREPAFKAVLRAMPGDEAIYGAFAAATADPS